MFASRPQRPELGSLNLITRGLQRRSSRKIERSTQWITGIVTITETASSSPLIRRREDRSGDLLVQKSGVKFIALHGMIWKSVNLF
jgi:hypothetical protein